MIDITEIYLDYHNKVYGFILHKINNPVIAEDLCSDVFLKINKNIESYDSSRSCISTWVYTITRNTIYDYFRTKHEYSELDEEQLSGEDIVEKICNDEMLETLAEALESLSEREREIVIRRYYHGEKLSKIAVRLGISYSYVKLLHSSALKEMGNYFDRH